MRREPEAAWQELKATIGNCNAKGIEGRRACRRTIKQALCRLVSALPFAKNKIRNDVLQLLLTKLEKSAAKFPKLAASSWFRVSDEDAHAIPAWSSIDDIVSGDNDSFMVNCHCADDQQVVVHLILRNSGQVVVRNARALKAAISRHLFPTLEHFPEAWWSRSPCAIDFNNPTKSWCGQ